MVWNEWKSVKQSYAGYLLMKWGSGDQGQFSYDDRIN